MQSRVYETVPCPSVRPLLQVCCCAGGQQILIDCCSSGGRMRAVTRCQQQQATITTTDGFKTLQFTTTVTIFHTTNTKVNIKQAILLGSNILIFVV